jgi:hypothetical protein
VREIETLEVNIPPTSKAPDRRREYEAERFSKADDKQSQREARVTDQLTQYSAFRRNVGDNGEMDDVYQFIIFSWVDKIKASIKFE